MAKRKQMVRRPVAGPIGQPKGDALAEKLREYHGRGVTIIELGSGLTEKELRELFNVSQDQLYKTVAFARYYEPHELDELCATRNADDNPLRWAHVRELLAYRDNKKARLKMQKRAIKDGWTVDELHEHVRRDPKANSRTSSVSPGRPFKCKSVEELLRKSTEIKRQLASLLVIVGEGEESTRRIDRLLTGDGQPESLQKVLQSLAEIERHARKLKRAVEAVLPAKERRSAR